MWRQNHPNAEPQDFPGDMTIASGSGLDPHITLQNDEFQLDRCTSKWAVDLKRDPKAIRKKIEQIVKTNASTSFGGLIDEKFANVLEVDLEVASIMERHHSCALVFWKRSFRTVDEILLNFYFLLR